MRQPQQEVREVETRSGNGRVVSSETAGQQAGEVEGAAAVRVGPGVPAFASELDAKREGMESADHDDVVDDRVALVARENGRGVAQRAKVGEIQIRRSIVEGIAGGPLDTEIERHVLSVGKIRRRLVPVTLEGHSNAVDKPRGNAPSPLQMKTERLGHIAVATLERDSVRQPVLFCDVAL